LIYLLNILITIILKPVHNNSKDVSGYCLFVCLFLRMVLFWVLFYENLKKLWMIFFFQKSFTLSSGKQLECKYITLKQSKWSCFKAGVYFCCCFIWLVGFCSAREQIQDHVDARQALYYQVTLPELGCSF
jgi:hypothetical protein